MFTPVINFQTIRPWTSNPITYIMLHGKINYTSILLVEFTAWWRIKKGWDIVFSVMDGKTNTNMDQYYFRTGNPKLVMANLYRWSNFAVNSKS